MAQTCFSVPAGTTNAVSISHSQSITSSVSTSTAPGSVVSSVISTCTPVAPVGPTVSGSGATPPAPSCVPVVTTVYTTLPGTITVVTVPVTVVVDYSVTNPVTLFGTSCSTISIYTPPPVTVTPPPVTSTSYATSTETSYSIFTPPPSTIVVGVTLTSGSSTITSSIISTSTFAPSSVVVTVTQTAASDVISSQKKSTPIGPIVGGVLGGLVALLLLGFIAWKLIKRRTNNDTFDPDYHRNNVTGIPEPKPYDSVGTMPPPQPPLQGFNDIGPPPSQAPGHHHRSPSQVPLLGAAGLAGAGGGAASLFNPSQPGYNAPGFTSGPGQAAVPTSSLVPNTSVGSMGSVPSTYATPPWGGGTTGPYQPPTVPFVGGFAPNIQQQHYEDSLNRTGSPVSSHEQQILQVTDAEPRVSVYDPNTHYPEPSSSSSPGPSFVPGSSSVITDGKGRRLNVVGEKTPVVHLDGGLFEEQPAPVVQSGPAPPAYTE